MRAAGATLLGLLLLGAALLKANAPGPAFNSLQHLLVQLPPLEDGGAAPHAVTYYALTGVTVLEIVIGSLLLIGWRRRIVLAVTMAALFVFSFGMAALALDPQAPACGCLGAVKLAQSAHTENLLGLGRNALLMAACVWLLSPRVRERADAQHPGQDSNLRPAV